MDIKTKHKNFVLDDEHLFFLPPEDMHAFKSDMPNYMLNENDMVMLQDGIELSLDEKWKAIRFLILNELKDNHYSGEWFKKTMQVTPTEYFNWCYFIAINKTSLSVAAILLYTAPSIVMVFSAILFKEKMTSKKIVSLALTFVGCIFVTAFVQGTGHEITLTGILAGLGAGLGYALYSIFGRYALKKYDPFLLYTKGLTYLETSKASIFATLEPIVATVIGIILYGEPITSFKIAGISIVIFAVSINREKSES